MLHHTDKIYILADHKTAPELSTEEIRYLGDATEHSPEKELALLYSNENARPDNTAQWLVGRKIKAVHHLKMFEQKDFEKLARFATGNAIGLALGGGGAKGFAHIGLLKAFFEEGIPVDMIGGTSAGAIVASVHAMGYTISETEMIMKKMMSDKKIMNDFTIPIISLIRGKIITNSLKIFAGEKKIEDLWIPYFCVATNLTRASKHIFDKGSLRKALRASASIPGILPPLYDDGELLVDGAMLDNVPGSVVKQKGAGFVISVGLATDTDPFRDHAYRGIFLENEQGIAPSVWSVLRRKIQTFKKKDELPGLLSLLMRSAFVASDVAVSVAKADSDLYINLPLEKYGLFDWKKFNAIVEVGYTYGKQHAKEWKKQIGI